MNDDDYAKRWRTVWAVWLIVIAVSFVILEGAGLINRRPGDTLSEAIRHWIGTTDTWKTVGAAVFSVALIGFTVWFVPHIVFSVW